MKTAAIVLLIHGGGFLGGHAQEMRPYVEQFRAQGIPAKSVEYRTADPRHGLVDVRRAMRRELRRGRRVFVVGHSAGGTLALRLAQTGKPEAVVALAPVADVTDWRATMVPQFERTGEPTVDAFWQHAAAELSPRVVRALDPSRHSCRRMSRTFVVAGTADVVVPVAGARRFAARCRRVRLRVTADDHPSVLEAPVAVSWRAWVAARVARSR